MPGQVLQAEKTHRLLKGPSAGKTARVFLLCPQRFPVGQACDFVIYTHKNNSAHDSLVEPIHFHKKDIKERI